MLYHQVFQSLCYHSDDHYLFSDGHYPVSDGHYQFSDGHYSLVMGTTTLVMSTSSLVIITTVVVIIRWIVSGRLSGEYSISLRLFEVGGSDLSRERTYHVVVGVLWTNGSYFCSCKHMSSGLYVVMDRPEEFFQINQIFQAKG